MSWSTGDPLGVERPRIVRTGRLYREAHFEIYLASRSGDWWFDCCASGSRRRLFVVLKVNSPNSEVEHPIHHKLRVALNLEFCHDAALVG